MPRSTFFRVDGQLCRSDSNLLLLFLFFVFPPVNFECSVLDFLFANALINSLVVLVSLLFSPSYKDELLFHDRED